MSSITAWKNSPPKDFLIEVQKGNIPGHSLVHKFGRNGTVPNGTFEMISLLSIPTAFAQQASTMHIKAGGNAADTAAGAGAREVTLQGIDDNLVVVTEAVATNGALASSATTASFWRVFRAWVSAVGTYGGTNTGNITIEDSSGPTDTIVIGAGAAQSQFGGYTIPLGKRGFLLSALIVVDALKAADVRFVAREGFNDVAAPYTAARVLIYLDAVLGELDFQPHSPGGPFPALTDIWWEASGGGASTEVSVDFEILLIEDGF